MRIETRLAPLLLVTALAGTLPAGGNACAFHNYVPEETVVDKMLGSEHIVIARPDPDNPVRYRVTEAIVGPAEGVDLPFPVDEASLARLAANPSDALLFAREGAYGPWQELAYLDAAYRPVIDHVAQRLEDWQLGGDEERFQLFADLHGHPHPDLRRLALSELDRAPYEILRHLEMDPDASRILNVIWQEDMLDFLPIHILLLGLSGDAEAWPALERGLDAALPVPQGSFIGAWATAMIEHGGLAAVDLIAARLRDDATLEPDVREQVIEAFAIHAGAGDPAVQERIGGALQTLLAQDPAHAAMVARQLGSRGNWSRAAELQMLLASGQITSAVDLISVSRYVSFAREASAPADSAGN